MVVILEVLIHHVTQWLLPPIDRVEQKIAYSTGTRYFLRGNSLFRVLTTTSTRTNTSLNYELIPPYVYFRAGGSLFAENKKKAVIGATSSRLGFWHMKQSVAGRT